MARLNNDELFQLILDGGFLDELELQRAHNYAQQHSLDLERALLDLELISDEHLGQLVASELGTPFVRLANQAIDPKLLELIPQVFAEENQIMVFHVADDGVHVALHDPTNVHLIQLIRKRVGLPVRLYYATLNDLCQAHKLYKRNMGQEIESIAQQALQNKNQAASTDDSEVIKMVDWLLDFAYTSKASDLHAEPHEGGTSIRFRIDGVLKDMLCLPIELHDRLITRFKILGHLRTDEHFAAQDGHIKHQLGDESVDIRMSILPTTFGEKLVLRLLSEKGRQFSLQALGLSEQNLELLKHHAKKPWGMILVTGPTGSGKTTSLYAALKFLNRREVNISTIEDPVEYSIGGVNQIQVNPRTELTFSRGLRSIVRQDPDIIMVGEIRDQETADISVNAALTGHLLLSTLHTNDAATALPRLIDMGVEPFLVASTVNMVIAQRLLRRICSNCIHSTQVSLEELQNEGLFVPESMQQYLFVDGQAQLYKGAGCDLCHQSGYKGRTGVFEILTVDGETRRMIVEQASSDVLRQHAIEQGMKTMFMDGLEKIRSGQTTIEELLRIVRE